MKTISHFSRLMAALGLLLPVAALAGFPFWLDMPQRSNPLDPKSTLFHPTPTPLPTLPPPSTPTTTPSATPSFSITPTFSVTPTRTDSRTETPYAGSPTDTFSDSPTPTISQTHSATPSPSPSSTPSRILFEDFLSTPLSPAYYSGGTAPSSSWNSVEFVSPGYSLKMVVPGANGGYVGMNIASNYGVINATGALSLNFWMKSDTTFSGSFTVRFSENQAGIQNENWRSPNLSITGGSGWRKYSLDLSGFIEDDFGDGACSGSCSSQGNNTMELAAVDKFEIQFGAFGGTANIFLDDIEFNLSPAATATPIDTFSMTRTPTPFAGSPTPSFTATQTAVGVTFEDFELAAPLNPAPYGASSSPASSWGTTEFISFNHGWHLLTSATSWGAGINIDSNYGIIDATGATSLTFWVKADSSATFTVRFSENQAGIENENWRSPDQNVTGGAGWTVFDLPLSGFVEDDFGDGACSGSCSSQGNGLMELGAIDKFEIQFAAPLTNANFDLDDIRFLTGAVSTPTPTFTPCTASATFGKTAVGVFINGAAATYPETSPYAFVSGGTVVSLSLYVGAVTGQVQVGIYADSGTKPSTRLSVSAPVTPLANQWNTIPVTPVTLAPGTYYLAWQKQTAGTEIHFDAGANGDAYFAFSGNAFGSMPATYPVGTDDTMQWSIYANYCP